MAGVMLTEPKAKADKEAGKFAKTVETYVRELWLKNEFGYVEKVLSKEMLKGLLCQDDSFGLIHQVLGGEFRIENKIRFENNYFTGRPDLVLQKEDFVEDAKTSWSLKTFMNADLDPMYYWQGQVYMDLTGKRNFRLCYCLVPTPEELVSDEESRAFYRFGNDTENKHYLEISQQIRHNNDLILKIAPEKRIKVFTFQYDKSDIERLYAQIEKARIYYDSLVL